MWAFARLQIPDERFFDLLGDMCVRKMELFNAQNLTNVNLRCMNQTGAARLRHRRDVLHYSIQSSRPRRRREMTL